MRIAYINHVFIAVMIWFLALLSVVAAIACLVLRINVISSVHTGSRWEMVEGVAVNIFTAIMLSAFAGWIWRRRRSMT